MTPTQAKIAEIKSGPRSPKVTSAPVLTVTSLVESLDVRVDGKMMNLVQLQKDVLAFSFEDRDLNDLCTKLNASKLVSASLAETGPGTLKAAELFKTGAIRLNKGKSYTFKANVETHSSVPNINVPMVHVIHEEDMDEVYLRGPEEERSVA